MNILIFGPNGSGKGTQGAIVQKKYGVPHIETGVIFRQNISKKLPWEKRQKRLSIVVNWYLTILPSP